MLALLWIAAETWMSIDIAYFYNFLAHLILCPCSTRFAQWLSEDCQPGSYQNRSLLRTKKVWLQEEVTMASLPVWSLCVWLMFELDR